MIACTDLIKPEGWALIALILSVPAYVFAYEAAERWGRGDRS